MNIQIPQLTQQTSSVAQLQNLQQLIKVLQVGQVLNASVKPHPQPNMVNLAIGRHELPAKTDINFKPGDQVLLKLEGKSPQVHFKVMEHKTTSLPIKPALMAKIPQQQPISPLFAELASVATQMPAKPVIAHQGQIIQFIKTILNNKPTTDSIKTASGLKQAIKQSGNFLESLLIDPELPELASTLKSDTKAQLLQLLQLLQHSQKQAAPQQQMAKPSANSNPESKNTSAQQPIQTKTSPVDTALNHPGNAKPLKDPKALTLPLVKQLIDTVKHTISRIEVNQLQGKLNETTHQPTYLIELPIMQKDQVSPLQIYIKDNAETAASTQQKHFTVFLNFNLLHQGGIQTQVDYQHASMQLNFWVEQSDTLHWIKDNINLLETQLNANGIALNTLEFHLGLNKKLIPELNSNIVNIEV